MTDEDEWVDDGIPDKLWAAWFYPGTYYKKPTRVTRRWESDPGQWWADNGDDSVTGLGLHKYKSADGDYEYGPLMFASKDKDEVQHHIDFARALFGVMKERLGV